MKVCPPQVALLAALAFTSACSGENDGNGSPDAAIADTVALRGACDADKRLGGFEVVVDDGFSSVWGKVGSRPLPKGMPQLLLKDGACQLQRRLNPLCNPGCAPGTVCDHDGSCVAQPQSQNVGDVTVSGLARDLTMYPEPGNNYSFVELPHPVVAAGALVTLSSTPGFVGEMLMHGIGGQALSGLDAEWVVQPGTAITVSWTPPMGAVRTTIHTELNIDQDGFTPATIVCEFDDTGTGTISATAIDQLLATGVSGFPRGRVTRRTLDSMSDANGCVELSVERPHNIVVRVDM